MGGWVGWVGWVGGWVGGSSYLHVVGQEHHGVGVVIRDVNGKPPEELQNTTTSLATRTIGSIEDRTSGPKRR